MASSSLSPAPTPMMNPSSQSPLIQPKPLQTPPKSPSPTHNNNNNQTLSIKEASSEKKNHVSKQEKQERDKEKSGVPDVITLPSYSRWFSLDKIHEVEKRFLPDFFNGKSTSRTPEVYEYYRRTIVRKYREETLRKKITFTEVRKVLVGDVGSIRRVFDFLESWGLINYTPIVVKQPVVKQQAEEKESKKKDSSNPSYECSKKTSTRKLCTGCRTLCSIACFVYDKAVEQAELTLCARCFVGGNYPKGITYGDFRRVEISEEAKSGWNDKETLQLLEAITHYGDDWKKVAEHVGGRSEQECVTYFIKLPFGEQFFASENPEVKMQIDVEPVEDVKSSSSSEKKRQITPLADASNPIMAQAAFLTAMVGREVARASAQAAVAALYDEHLTVDHRKSDFALEDIEQKDSESITSTNGISNSIDSFNIEEAVIDAGELIQKEELDMEKSISDIVGVQMKDLQDKIIHLEEADLQLEKERQQLQHMKNLLFSDQLDLLFHHKDKLDRPEAKINNVVP